MTAAAKRRPREATNIEFFEVIFGDTDAGLWLQGDTRYADPGNGAGWHEWSRTWPAEAEVIAAELIELSKTEDVYYCTSLREPIDGLGRYSRKISKPVALDVLHADVDRPPKDPELYAELEPLRVLSGGRENGWAKQHAYLKLTEPVDENVHRVLERALCDRLGADNKIDHRDVLRPPGTLNHKTDPPGKVEVAEWWGDPWAPDELAERLGADLDDEGPRSDLDRERWLSDEDVEAWLDAHDGKPCRAMAATFEKERAELEAAAEGSRQPTALAATFAITALAGEGHRGAAGALDELHGLYLESLAGERGRDPEGEWSRMTVGAVAKLSKHETPAHPPGHCPSGFDDLLRPPARGPGRSYLDDVRYARRLRRLARVCRRYTR